MYQQRQLQTGRFEGFVNARVDGGWLGHRHHGRKADTRRRGLRFAAARRRRAGSGRHRRRA